MKGCRNVWQVLLGLGLFLFGGLGWAAHGHTAAGMDGEPGLGNPPGEGAGEAVPLGTLLRTLVYHEIPLVGLTGVDAYNRSMVLSANGNRIAFQRGYDPNTIYVVNADGTGLTLVDAYTPTCYCNSGIDISQDGSKVLSWDGAQKLRVANADGSGAQDVLTLEGGYKYFRLSKDGTKVFFTVDRGWTQLPSGTSRSGGLYVVNTNGTGLTQLVTPEQATALFGKTPGEIPFHASGVAFDISADNGRIVFQAGVPDRGHELFRVNGDGTGLQAYAVFPLNYHYGIPNLGISGDGTKVFYNVLPNPCCSTPSEWGVFDYDGTGKRVLRTGAYSYDEAVGLTNDGAKLSLSSDGLIVNTDGSGSLALSLWLNWYTTDPESIIDAYFMTMNQDGTRFAYLDWCYGCGPLALGRLDIVVPALMPDGLGEAPAIEVPEADPPYVLRDGSVWSTFSARVESLYPVVRVAAGTLLAGIQDAKVWSPVLLDDGTQGDETAGDGTYTSNQVNAASDAVLGPRTVRIRVDVKEPGGLRHATAVDAEPFEVRDTIPTVAADFRGAPTSGKAPLEVNFTDLSSGGTVTSWNWTFGDGGTSTAKNPTHTYTTAGTFTVSLTVDGPTGSDTESKTGYITVSGSDCAAEHAVKSRLADRPAAAGRVLDRLRAFRAGVLTGTIAGSRWIAMYERHTEEVVLMLSRSPEFADILGRFLVRAAGTLSTSQTTGTIVVPSELLQEFEGILAWLGSRASGPLAWDLEEVRAHVEGHSTPAPGGKTRVSVAR